MAEVNVGDNANLLKGAIDSHDVHNNVSNVDNSVSNNIVNNTNQNTTNQNIVYQAQRTELEILQDNENEYLIHVQERLSDGRFTTQVLAELHQAALKCRISTERANQIIDQVRKNIEVIQSGQSSQFLAAQILNEVFNAIQANEVEIIKRKFRTLEQVAKTSEDSNVQYYYHLLLASFSPESSVLSFINSRTDNYWQLYWAHIAYVKLGNIDNGSVLLPRLGGFGTPEGDTSLLMAIDNISEYYSGGKKTYFLEQAQQYLEQACNLGMSDQLSPLWYSAQELLTENPKPQEWFRFYLETTLNGILPKKAKEVPPAKPSIPEPPKMPQFNAQSVNLAQMQGFNALQAAKQMGLGQMPSMAQTQQQLNSMANNLKSTMPQMPGFQQMSQMPGFQQMTQMPGFQQMPQMTGNQQIPQMPGYQQMPQMPGNQQMPQMPGNQQMPQMPGNQQMPQMPGSQQMPQMPGSQQMPPMPGFQQMPQMPGNQQMPQMPSNQQMSQMPGKESATNAKGHSELVMPANDETPQPERVSQYGILFTDSISIAQKYNCEPQELYDILEGFIKTAAEDNMNWYLLDAAHYRDQINKDSWEDHNSLLANYIVDNGFQAGVATPVFIIGGSDVIPVPKLDDPHDDGMIPSDMPYCFENGYFDALLNGERTLGYEQIRNTISRLPLEVGKSKSSLFSDLQSYFNLCSLFGEGIEVPGVAMASNVTWTENSVTMSQHLPLIHHRHVGEDEVYKGMYMCPKLVTDAQGAQIEINSHILEDYKEALEKAGMLLFNLHGSDGEDNSGFYCDSEGGCSESFNLDLMKHSNARVLNTVACFGAHYDGYDRSNSMLMSSLLGGGKVLYAGSTIAVPMLPDTQQNYPQGATQYPGSGSEKFMPIYCYYLFCGIPAGQAMMMAKLDYFNTFRSIERDDFALATIMMFGLYGNPMLHIKKRSDVIEASHRFEVLPGVMDEKSAKTPVNIPIKSCLFKRNHSQQDKSILEQLRGYVDHNLSAIHEMVMQNLYNALGLEPRWLDQIDKINIPGNQESEEGFVYYYDKDNKNGRKSMVEVDKKGQVRRTVTYKSDGTNPPLRIPKRTCIVNFEALPEGMSMREGVLNYEDQKLHAIYDTVVEQLFKEDELNPKWLNKINLIEKTNYDGTQYEGYVFYYDINNKYGHHSMIEIDKDGKIGRKVVYK